MSEQTKGSVAAVGGGIFYAANVRNASTSAAPIAMAFNWEGGGVT